MRNELTAKAFASRTEKILPKFALSFDGSQENCIHISKDRTQSLLEQLTIINTLPLEIPQHLQKYLTLDEIKDYNEQVESVNIDIIKYNAAINLYNQLISFKSIKFTLSNVGQCKATNVIIDFEFPKEFILRHTTDKHPEEPEHPIIPKNPIIKAMTAYEKKRIH